MGNMSPKKIFKVKFLEQVDHLFFGKSLNSYVFNSETFFLNETGHLKLWKICQDIFNHKFRIDFEKVAYDEIRL